MSGIICGPDWPSKEFGEGAVNHRQNRSCGTGVDLADLDPTTPVIVYIETSQNRHQPLMDIKNNSYGLRF